MDNKRITVSLNYFGPPLKKEKIDNLLNYQENNQSGMLDWEKRVLEYFFDLPLCALSREILERYIEITTEDSNVPIVPRTEEIDERLLKPLKSAKKNYCLGDYLATIASCGIIGEMLAILVWKISEVKIRGNLITEEDEERLFSRKFEKLGQERRLEILKVLHFVNDSQYNKFNSIRKSRTPYLHLWTTDLKNEKEKAKKCVEEAFSLFKEIINLKLKDARSLSINPQVLKLFKNE
jgi:hypothetical protein